MRGDSRRWRAWTIAWACGWGGCPQLPPPLSLWPPTRHLSPAETKASLSDGRFPKGLLVHGLFCALVFLGVFYLAAMLQEQLQDVQVLVLDGDGHGVSAQHVHAVDVELTASVLLQELLHHVVVTCRAPGPQFWQSQDYKSSEVSSEDGD